MADIIDKIGKYFADQEAQLRNSFVQASAAQQQKQLQLQQEQDQQRQARTVPQQPVSEKTDDAELFPARRRRVKGAAHAAVASPSLSSKRPQSLLRRRLSLPDRSPVVVTVPTTTVTKRDEEPAVGDDEEEKPAIDARNNASDDHTDQFKEDLPDTQLWCGDAQSWPSSHQSDFSSCRSDESNRTSEPASTTGDITSRSSRSSTRSTISTRSHTSSSSNTSTSTTSSTRRKLLRSNHGMTTKKKTKKKSASSASPLLGAERIAAREKAQRAADGLALAQERAHRIRMEKLQRDRQHELEREQSLAKLQDEMAKIEAIRRKGKQFALRLRAQSAPGVVVASKSDAVAAARLTASVRTPSDARLEQDDDHDDNVHYPTSGGEGATASRLIPTKEDAVERTNQDVGSPRARERPPSVSVATRGFLDQLERQEQDRLRMEVRILARLQDRQQQREHAWTQLQTRLHRQQNAIRATQQRVTQLTTTKQALEKELGSALEATREARKTRQQLDHAADQQRCARQREAERALHSRLRQEEAQSLVEEERARSVNAVHARARAKERVLARATLRRRVLHGADSDAGASSRSRRSRREGGNNNHREEEREEDGEKGVVGLDAWALPPELAEFEEEGLNLGVDTTTTTTSSSITSTITLLTKKEGGWQANDQAVDASPTTIGLQDLATTSCQWRVPPLSAALVAEILDEEVVSSSDDEDLNAQTCK